MRGRGPCACLIPKLHGVFRLVWYWVWVSTLQVVRRIQFWNLRFFLRWGWRCRCFQAVWTGRYIPTIRKKHTASIFVAEDGESKFFVNVQPRWRHYVFPELWHLPACPHGVKTHQRAANSIRFWFVWVQYDPYLQRWNWVLLISQNWLISCRLPVFGAWRKIWRPCNRDVQFLF